jgi:hypothetical protein
MRRMNTRDPFSKYLPFRQPKIVGSPHQYINRAILHYRGMKGAELARGASMDLSCARTEFEEEEAGMYIRVGG